MLLKLLRFLSDQPAQASGCTIIDFDAQPMVAQLAGQLHHRGHELCYITCPANRTLPAQDVSRLRTLGVPTYEALEGQSLDHEAHTLPIKEQVQLGYALNRKIRSGTVIACGLPWLTSWIVRVATQYRNGRFVNWLQGATDLTLDWEQVAAARFQRSQIQRADLVICPSDELLAHVRSCGRNETAAVLPPWGLVDQVSVGVRENDWAIEQGLRSDRFRVIYAGKLGPTNRGGDISRAVKELLMYNRFEFVFAAEGDGYDELKYDPELSNSGYVHFVGLHRGEALQDVLASADMLLASIDPSVTEVAVSANVLAYLCAGRPIVALAERHSLSARMIRKAGAGRIITSADQLSNGIFKLLHEPDDAQLEGKKGRQFAERFFVANAAANRFVNAAELPDPVPARPTQSTS